MSGKPILRKGMQYLAELPPGRWRMTTCGDAVICACPEHEPRIIRPQPDGSVEIDILTVSGAGMLQINRGH